jgi:hypothetical protein
MKKKINSLSASRANGNSFRALLKCPKPRSSFYRLELLEAAFFAISRQVFMWHMNCSISRHGEKM